MQSLQMNLSKKLKTFSEVFYGVLEFRLNFEYFESKDDPHSVCISEIADCEIHAWRNV